MKKVTNPVGIAVDVLELTLAVKVVVWPASTAVGEVSAVLLVARVVKESTAAPATKLCPVVVGCSPSQIRYVSGLPWMFCAIDETLPSPTDIGLVARVVKVVKMSG